MTLIDSNIEMIEMIRYSDMGHRHFLDSTGDMGNNKGQRHATLAFLKIDMRPRHYTDPGPYRTAVSMMAKGHISPSTAPEVIPIFNTQVH